MSCPNFMEKTFVDGSETMKFMTVFSFDSFLLYGILTRNLLNVDFLYAYIGLL